MNYWKASYVTSTTSPIILSLSIYLVREAQYAIGFTFTIPNLVVHEPDNTVGFFDEILEGHMDFTDVLVSEHDTLVAQIEMNKHMITILDRNLVQIKAHLVVPFRIPIAFSDSGSSLLLIGLQFFVGIMADKRDKCVD